MANYEIASGSFPGRAIFDKQGKPLLSWRVSVLPYMDRGDLYHQFRLDEPWDGKSMTGSDRRYAWDLPQPEQ